MFWEVKSGELLKFSRSIPHQGKVIQSTTRKDSEGWKRQVRSLMKLIRKLDDIPTDHEYFQNKYYDEIMMFVGQYIKLFKEKIERLSNGVEKIFGMYKVQSGNATGK